MFWRKLWKAVLAMAVIQCFNLGAVAEKASDLKVMTYNVRYGTADDGENAWPKRRETLIRSIQHYDPDIIGVQECLDFQAEYIAAALPQYRWVGVGREADGTGEMSAILYRHAELMPIESGNFWLSQKPEVPGSKSWDTDCTRMATWAKFYRWRAKQHFYHFNTHLDHRSAEARHEGAKLIVDRVHAIAGDAPAILTGDFNASGGTSEPWQAAERGGFQDAWTTAEKTTGPANTWNAFKGVVPGDGSRIDWILYRGALTSLHCETVTYTEDGRYPSDHCAVFARFRM